MTLNGPRNVWEAFIAAQERDICEMEDQLRPLENNDMRIGTRGPETGGVWRDDTQREINTLKQAIANLRALVADTTRQLDERDAQRP